MCLCVCVSQKSTSAVVPQKPFTQILEADFLIVLEVADSTKLSEQQTLGIHLFMTPQCWHWQIDVGTRNKFQDLMLFVTRSLLISIASLKCQDFES